MCGDSVTFDLSHHLQKPDFNIHETHMTFKGKYICIYSSYRQLLVNAHPTNGCFNS